MVAYQVALTGFTFLVVTLEWVRQKVYPNWMKLLRLFLFTWLSLALSGSGWAYQPSCATTGHEHAAISDAASIDNMPAHTGHQHKGHDTMMSGADEQPDPVPACECCDTCMTSCAFSLSAMTALFGTHVPIFDASSVGSGLAIQRAPPPHYPLLRPPIPTV